MAWEIERKFLVQSDRWRDDADVGITYAQGYLSTHPERSVRVRIAGDRGYLTIKGKSEGLRRREFNYAIPVDEAWDLLEYLCPPPLIEKTRYRLPLGDVVWEIDEFAGDNEGLIIAEVELNHPEQTLSLPDWLGEEVTHDPRYYNAQLSQIPYCQWDNSRGYSESSVTE